MKTKIPNQLNTITKTIHVFKFYDEIPFPNFIHDSEPIEKGDSQLFNFLNDESSACSLYYDIPIQIDNFHAGDIDDFNKSLWVKKDWLLKIKKVLKRISYKGSLYNVVTTIMFLKHMNKNGYQVSKKNLKKEHSAVRFIEAIRKINIGNLYGNKITIYNPKLFETERFDDETSEFINDAVNYYLNSSQGSLKFKEITDTDEERKEYYHIVSSLQGKNILQSRKSFKIFCKIKLEELIKSQSKRMLKSELSSTIDEIIEIIFGPNISKI